MEREVPLFCGEAVVSYREANVAQLERKASPTFLLRFVSLRFAFRCFVWLHVASLCFVLLRVAPLCFTLLHVASWKRSGLVLGFRSVLLHFASFRFVSLCFLLFGFASLCFALVCCVLLCFVSFCSVLLNLRFVLLRFALFCFVLLRFAGIFSILLRCASWERSVSVLGWFWERLGRYFRRSGELNKASASWK